MISLADEPIRVFPIYVSVFNILHLFLVLSTLSTLPGLLIYSPLSLLVISPMNVDWKILRKKF